MKKLVRLTAVAMAFSLFASCTATYDAYGQPQQSIDPAAAAIGAVALGAIAYSVGKDHGNHHRYHHRPHYGHRPPCRGGYRY